MLFNQQDFYSGANLRRFCFLIIKIAIEDSTQNYAENFSHNLLVDHTIF